MNQETEKKKVTAAKPGILGKTTRIILIVVIFLVIFAALYFVYQQQAAQQADLSKNLSSLQKVVSAQSTAGPTPEMEIMKAEEDLQVVKDSFYRLDGAPEILDKLIYLAKANNIEI